MDDFSKAWDFSGTTNLRHSNAEDHAKGEPHMSPFKVRRKAWGGIRKYVP